MRKFVDVSNNNGSVDFKAVKAAGAVGVYLKVTEGIGFVDPTYEARRSEAKAAGLQVGGYHFGHPENDPALELKFFLSHLRLEKGDLKPALDLETTDDKSHVVVHTFAAKFLAGLEGHIKELPVLYSGSPFMSENVIDVLPARHWIPSYGARPSLFSWDAWQYTDGEARFGRSPGNLDESVAVSIALMTYQAPLVHRVHGHVKKRVHHSLAWIIAHKNNVPNAWKRWWKKRFKKHA